MRQSKAFSFEITKTRAITKSIWVVAFTGLTFLGAKIEIPTQPVPYTLQTMFVLLSGAFLGPYFGALSQLLYLALGSVGLPVFAGPIAGFAKLLGPTGGYLLAFPVSALVVGYLVRFKDSFPWILFSMFIGLIIIFAFGTIQLNFVLIHNWKEAIKSGFLIFSFWDALKLVASASIYRTLKNKVSLIYASN
jgi:biotin transport system substrate-specific component